MIWFFVLSFAAILVDANLVTCPVVPPTVNGDYRVRLGMGAWNKFATYANLDDPNKEFIVEMVHNCPAASESFRIFLGENQPGGDKKDLVATVDINTASSVFNIKMRIYDCNGNLLYFVDENQKNYLTYKTNLQVCKDEDCNIVIGFSEAKGYFDKEVILTPLIDNHQVSNNTIRAIKEYEYIDANPRWDVRSPKYVPGVSPEVHDPIILTSIITLKLFETRDAGLCNTFFIGGIIVAVVIGLSCIGAAYKMYKKKYAGSAYSPSSSI